MYVQAAASKLQEAFGGQPMPDSSGGIGRRVLAGGPSPCSAALHAGARAQGSSGVPSGAREHGRRRKRSVGVGAEAPVSSEGGGDGGRLRKQWRADFEGGGGRSGGAGFLIAGRIRDAGDGGAVSFGRKQRGKGMVWCGVAELNWRVRVAIPYGYGAVVFYFILFYLLFRRGE